MYSQREQNFTHGRHISNVLCCKVKRREIRLYLAIFRVLRGSFGRKTCDKIENFHNNERKFSDLFADEPHATVIFTLICFEERLGAIITRCTTGLLSGGYTQVCIVRVGLGYCSPTRAVRSPLYFNSLVMAAPRCRVVERKIMSLRNGFAGEPTYSPIRKSRVRTVWRHTFIGCLCLSHARD